MDKTQTERIRAELDGRGIEYECYDMGHADGRIYGEPTLETTWFAANGLGVTFVEYPSGATRLHVWEPTAEQALDMAGRGECRNIVIDVNRNTPVEFRTDNFICSECHASFFADGEGINYPIDWGYCPNCGRRVMHL